MTNEYTAGFLFAGGGGCTEGAVKAKFKPIWAIEYDKYAASVYRYRFPQTQVIQEDITTLSAEFIRDLPTPTIIIGGSPCPDFSFAGNRAGIEGDRGQLFFKFIYFLQLLQPSLFAFENVEGLLSSGGGQDFIQVINAFAKVGYMGTGQLRNGNRHAPQNRSRVFLVGIHRRHSGINTNALQKIIAGMSCNNY